MAPSAWLARGTRIVRRLQAHARGSYPPCADPDRDLTSVTINTILANHDNEATFDIEALASKILRIAVSTVSMAKN